MGKRNRSRRQIKCFRCKKVFAIGEPFKLFRFKNGFSAFACFDKEKCNRRIERNSKK